MRRRVARSRKSSLRELDRRRFYQEALPPNSSDHLMHAWLAVALRADVLKITAECLEGISFFIDLRLRPNPQPPKERHWRPPPVVGGVQHEAGHKRGEGEEPLIHGGAQGHAHEHGRRRIGFQRSFNVPFVFEFLEASIDRRFSLAGIAGNVFFGLLPDSPVVFLRGMERNSFYGGRDGGHYR